MYSEFKHLTVCTCNMQSCSRDWVLTSSFRGSVHFHPGGEHRRHGSSTCKLIFDTHAWSQREGENLDWCGILKPQGPPLVAQPSPVRPHLLILHKLSINWKPNIQKHEPMGTIYPHRNHCTTSPTVNFLTWIKTLSNMKMLFQKDNVMGWDQENRKGGSPISFIWRQYNPLLRRT